MELLQYWLVLLLMPGIEIVHARPQDVIDSELPCNSILSLAEALYSFPDNVLELTRVFYPPRQPPVQFLRITYLFNGTVDGDNECNVTYFWAKGGFLLIQPPSVFRFTSLFFNFNENTNYDIQLQLPSTCIPLVYDKSSSSSHCSCHREDDGKLGFLDMITHQLKLYAKFIDVSKVQYDDTVRTYAICESDLNDNYYFHFNFKKPDKVFYFLIATLLVPVISVILTATIVRSLYKGIHVRINRKSNHQNLAGFVLVGIFVTFYIVTLDSFAVYYAYSGNNEIIFNTTNATEDHSIKNSLNFISTITLLCYDGIVCLIPITILIYICCLHIGENTERPDSPKKLDRCLRACNGCLNKCLNYTFKQVFMLYFHVIFGSFNHEIWGDEKLRLSWIMTLSFIAPLFAINSHITFILVSWLTDTRRASSIALVYFAVLLYLFFMFRQCYTANAKKKHDYFCWSFFLPVYPLCQCCRFICACFCFCECFPFRKYLVNLDYVPVKFGNENFEDGENDTDKIENSVFNTKAFCVLFTWGWFLIASVALIIAAFLMLPIITFDLLSDLLNTFQIFIILVSLLITYKVLTLSEPDVLKFLRKMRHAFRGQKEGEDDEAPVQTNTRGSIQENVENYMQVDDVEAAGFIVGEMAKVIIHKNN